MTEIIETTCGWCGAIIRDYASNRRPPKNGNYYCSTSCSGKGIAFAKTGKPPKGKKKSDAEYYQRNTERLRDKSNEYYKRNSGDVIKKRQLKDRKLKQEIIDAYGGKCDCCGETTFEFLTVDHINGGGNEHRRRVGKGRKIYADIKKQGFPQGEYRLLCFNCNITLGFYGYCPHRPELKSNISHVPFNPGRRRTVK